MVRIVIDILIRFLFLVYRDYYERMELSLSTCEHQKKTKKNYHEITVQMNHLSSDQCEINSRECWFIQS